MSVKVIAMARISDQVLVLTTWSNQYVVRMGHRDYYDAGTPQGSGYYTTDLESAYKIFARKLEECKGDWNQTKWILESDLQEVATS